MSGNTADENTNRYPTTTEREITLEDVRQLEQGDAIALRVAIKKDVYYIVAGRVSSEPASKAEIREQLEEYDTAEVVTLDLNLWWVLTDGELIDRSHRLEDRPPSREFLDLPPKDAPPCSLHCPSYRVVSAVIPSPIYRGSRVHFYDTRPFGIVVALDSGGLAEPERLLPNKYDHPL